MASSGASDGAQASFFAASGSATTNTARGLAKESPAEACTAKKGKPMSAFFGGVSTGKKRSASGEPKHAEKTKEKEKEKFKEKEKVKDNVVGQSAAAQHEAQPKRKRGRPRQVQKTAMPEHVENVPLLGLRTTKSCTAPAIEKGGATPAQEQKMTVILFEEIVNVFAQDAVCVYKVNFDFASAARTTTNLSLEP